MRYTDDPLYPEKAGRPFFLVGLYERGSPS
jgi:hypothetical protein